MTDNRYRPVCSAAGLFAACLMPLAVSAQVRVAAQSWTLQADQPIEWLRFLPGGVFVVSSDAGLLGLDPATGTVRWRRDDLVNVSQTAYEAAQQGAPLPNSAQAAPARAPIIRLMEELPGGRLAAILADSGGRKSWFDVIDVRSGATVWSSTSLPVTEARGFLPFPDSVTILVHGAVIEPGRNRRIWLRVEAGTGRVLWSTDSLLLQSPAQFDASAMLASRGTVNGNQPLVALSDSSVLLYASGDGLVRFDAESGRVRWRVPLGDGLIAPIGQGYAPMLLVGDTAYLPAVTTVHAIDLVNGRHRWGSGLLPAMIVQLARTQEGVLVRGQPNLAAGQGEGRPFVALLDPQTGKWSWRNQYKLRSSTSPFLLNDGVGYVATDDGLARFPLGSGKDSLLTTGKLPGRPAVSLEQREDGMLIGASQSLTLISPDGSQRYQKEYRAPTMGLGGRLLRIALAGAAIAGGAYYSGGYLAGSAVAKYQFSTSRYSSTHAYFVLKDYEGGGPALAQIEKATGEIVAVISLSGDKSPEYVIDEASGTVVLLTADRTLTAYRW